MSVQIQRSDFLFSERIFVATVNDIIIAFFELVVASLAMVVYLLVQINGCDIRKIQVATIFDIVVTFDDVLVIETAHLLVTCLLKVGDILYTVDMVVAALVDIALDVVAWVVASAVA